MSNTGPLAQFGPRRIRNWHVRSYEMRDSVDPRFMLIFYFKLISHQAPLKSQNVALCPPEKISCRVLVVSFSVSFSL